MRWSNELKNEYEVITTNKIFKKCVSCVFNVRRIRMNERDDEKINLQWGNIRKCAQELFCIIIHCPWSMISMHYFWWRFITRAGQKAPHNWRSCLTLCTLNCPAIVHIITYIFIISSALDATFWQRLHNR